MEIIVGDKTKKYDNHKYYEAFKEKNKDKLNEKIICQVCDGSYSYFNKSAHNKSKRHMNALAIIEKYKKD
jgi:hypothetical protein